MMRSVTTVCIAAALFIAGSSTATAQWTNASPKGLGSTIWGMHFFSKNVGWIVGWQPSGGTSEMGRTIDGGANWEGWNMPGTLLFAIQFTDQNTGYVTGYRDACQCGLLLTTTNGGSTWSEQNFTTSDPTFSFGFYRVQFTSKTVGYLAGYNGAILKTTDAGATWKRTNTGTQSLVFRIMRFVDETTGYAMGGTSFAIMDQLYKTTDGGENWSLVGNFTGAISIGGIYFTDPMTGFMAGNGEGGAAIYKTVDGGVTWSRVHSGATEVVFQDIAFTSASVGYAVGPNGLILKTTDAGATWQDDSYPTQQHLMALFADPSGWAYTGGSTGTLLRNAGAQSSVIDEVTSAGALHPNPLTTAARLTLDRIDPTARYTVVVTDLLGRTVRTIAGEAGAEIVIEREGLATGTYLYTVMRGDHVASTGTFAVQ